VNLNSNYLWKSKKDFFEICEDKLDVVISDPNNMNDFAKYLIENVNLVRIL